MKNKTLKLICNIVLAVCLALSTVGTAQEATSFKITPELSKMSMGYSYMGDTEIYHLTPKVIDRFLYYKGNVETTRYKLLAEQLAERKPYFDEYNNKVKYNTDARKSIKIIITNINTYLETKNKQLLIDSQLLVDKYNFEVQISDNGFFALADSYVNNGSIASKSVKSIKLISDNKPASKTDLRSFAESIQKIELPQAPYKDDYRYNSYESTLSELQNTPQYKKGWVLSDTLKKTTIYLKDDVPMDINSLSGEFTSLTGSFVIVDNEVPNIVVKNQTISKTSPYYNQDTMINLKEHYVFKSSAGELYCVNNNMYIPSLQGIQDREQKQKEIDKIGETVAYKEWKEKYKSIIQLCFTNMNACNAIIAKYRYKNVYHEWIYLSSDFSKSDKIAFNKNIDSLQAKIHQLSEMEDSYSPDHALYNYYIDHTSTEEAIKSHQISQYFNSNKY